MEVDFINGSPNLRTVLTWNPGKIAWVAAGGLFALGSAMVHYQVKVVMLRTDDVAATKLRDLQVGSESPDFSATDLEGQQVVLSEFEDQKVVLLDFWASWCPPCLEAMPTLQQLHDEFKGRPVEILAVNLGEGRDHIRSFIERGKYTFRVVLDERQTIGSQFGVTAIPALVVVDGEGRVAHTQVGYRPSSANELRELLKRLTQELQPATRSPSEDSRGDRNPAAAGASPAAGPPGDGTAGVRNPRILCEGEPHPVNAARDADVRGAVTLSLEVREDGAAHHIRVLRCPGYNKHALTPDHGAACSQATFAVAAPTFRVRRTDTRGWRGCHCLGMKAGQMA